MEPMEIESEAAHQGTPPTRAEGAQDEPAGGDSILQETPADGGAPFKPAPSFPLPSRSLLCVEHPAHVRDVQRAITTLGGLPALTKVRRCRCVALYDTAVAPSHLRIEVLLFTTVLTVGRAGVRREGQAPGAALSSGGSLRAPPVR
jgi:hypothetical protein